MLSDETFAQEIAGNTAPIPRKINLANKATAFALCWRPVTDIVDQSANSTLPSLVESNGPIPSLSAVTLPDDLEPIDDTDLKKYLLPLYSRNWVFRPSRVYMNKIPRLSIIFEPKERIDTFLSAAAPFLDSLTEFGSSDNVSPSLSVELFVGIHCGILTSLYSR